MTASDRDDRQVPHLNVTKVWAQLIARVVGPVQKKYWLMPGAGDAS